MIAGICTQFPFDWWDSNLPPSLRLRGTFQTALNSDSLAASPVPRASWSHLSTVPNTCRGGGGSASRSKCCHSGFRVVQMWSRHVWQKVKKKEKKKDKPRRRPRFEGAQQVFWCCAVCGSCLCTHLLFMVKHMPDEAPRAQSKHWTKWRLHVRTSQDLFLCSCFIYLLGILGFYLFKSETLTVGGFWTCS